MSYRRIAEQLILRVKLHPAGVNAPHLAQLRMDLGDLFRELLEPGVALRWGGRYSSAKRTRIARLAALAGQSQTRQCIKYHAAKTGDDLLLDRGRRRFELGVGLWRQFTPTFPVQEWPDWQLALMYLLAVSRGDWTCVVLFGGRTDELHWRERLAQAWLGTADGLPTVVAAARDVEAVADELQRAACGWHPTANDPVQVFLQGLAAALQGFTLGAGNLPGFVTAVRKSLGRGAPVSEMYRALASALAHVQVVLSRPEGDPTAALTELVKETAPTAPLLVPAATVGELVPWLHGLSDPAPPHGWAYALGMVRQEVAPPLTHFPAAGDAVLSQDALFRCLRLAVARHDPPLQPPYYPILQSLLAGEDLDGICFTAKPRMPSPTDLPIERLGRIAEKLANWAVQAAPHDLEAMPRVWQSPVQTAAARAVVDGWRRGRPRPDAWADLPADEEPALRNAVCATCLDDLADDMKECFRRARRGQA